VQGVLTFRERLLRYLEGEKATRPVPALRVMRTGLRTAHLVAFGALYGGHVFALPAGRLKAALLATVLTGAALAALEVYHAPIWLVQLRGVATLVKIVLVALVAVLWNYRVALLTAVIVIGGISSHMPGRYRYFSVAHGRQVGGRESG